MIFKKVSKTVKSLVKSIKENPCDWSIEEYRATHTPTQNHIWVGNGYRYVKINGSVDTLNSSEKRAIYEALTQAAMLQMIPIEGA